MSLSFVLFLSLKNNHFILIQKNKLKFYIFKFYFFINHLSQVLNNKCSKLYFLNYNNVLVINW
jgi:hypothetical protein